MRVGSINLIITEIYTQFIQKSETEFTIENI